MEWKHRRSKGSSGNRLLTPYIASASFGFTSGGSGCPALSVRSLAGSIVRGMNWKSLLEREKTCPTSEDAERNGVSLRTTALQSSPWSFVVAMCDAGTNFLPRLLKAFVTTFPASSHMYVKTTMQKKKKRHATDHPFFKAFSAASFPLFTYLMHVLVQSWL